MKKEIISKIQSGELKASISDVNAPIPENIIILVTVRLRSDYRTTEILSFDQAVESFDADPTNEFVAFTLPRFLSWRQKNVPDEIIVASSVAKLL